MLPVIAPVKSKGANIPPEPPEPRVIPVAIIFVISNSKRKVIEIFSKENNEVMNGYAAGS